MPPADAPTTMACVVVGTVGALTLTPKLSAIQNLFMFRFPTKGDVMQLAKTVQPLTTTIPQWLMNRLLASLPADEYQRVSADLTWRPLKVRQVLHKHGEPISEVYFPGRSVCSITNVMEDG